MSILFITNPKPKHKEKAVCLIRSAVSRVSNPNTGTQSSKRQFASMAPRVPKRALTGCVASLKGVVASRLIHCWCVEFSKISDRKRGKDLARPNTDAQAFDHLMLLAGNNRHFSQGLQNPILQPVFFNT